MKHIFKKKHKKQNIFFSKSIVKQLFVTWFLLFFAGLIITQQEGFLKMISSSPEHIVFSFSGSSQSWGLAEIPNQVHGAADDWSYLFEDENTKQPVYQATSSGSQTTDNLNNNLPSETDDLPIGKDEFPIDDQSLSEMLSGKAQSGTNISGTQMVVTGNVSVNTGSLEDDKFCTTPWGEYVANKDFVLAYIQRNDVNNICNVQKRYCSNGKLTGSYPQKACIEHTAYSYTKPEAISYTQKPVDPFIQPKAPSLSGADFDNHGKINGKPTSIDTRYYPSSGKPTSTTSVSQSSTNQRVCITPRGERVNNGRFVKAYKSSLGLLDLPCEVEIRLCVKGALKGSYKNRSCTFKKMTYRDYLVQNTDINQATPGDLLNSLDTEETKTTYDSSSFWKWLNKYF